MLHHLHALFALRPDLLWCVFPLFSKNMAHSRLVKPVGLMYNNSNIIISLSCDP